MAPITELSHITNPLVSPDCLETSASQLDGVPKDLEDSVRFQTARLLQAAGVLLRLPQDLIAQSITILYRFWVGPDGGSMLEYDARDVAAAALYLTAKPSGNPISPRHTLVVFEYLIHLGDEYAEAATGVNNLAVEWHLSEGMYEAARNRLYAIESHILRVLGFQTHVALPYTLCINYLQALEISKSTGGPAVSKRAFAHLNSALLSPQLLYLTHQPSALATAAIYLAAREMDVKLPEANWWEVFDVDREQLGFLVVALRSVVSYAKEEKRSWAGVKVPMTVQQLRSEMERRSLLGDSRSP